MLQALCEVRRMRDGRYLNHKPLPADMNCPIAPPSLPGGDSRLREGDGNEVSESDFVTPGLESNLYPLPSEVLFS